MGNFCIYCRLEKPLEDFNSEHVIPSAFGCFPTMNNSPQLKKEVCKICNQFFGDTIDNFLARHSFEGIKRLSHGLGSHARGAHKQVYFEMKSLSEDKTKPSPIFYMDRERKKLDIAYGVRLHNKNDIKKFVNLLLDLRKKEQPTLSCITPGECFNPKDWVGQIGRFELWSKNDEQQALIISILKKWNIEIDLPEIEKKSFKEIMPAKEGEEEFIISAYVNREIFRAVSKILFNYAAFHLGAEEVLKSEWDICRRYIRYNENNVGKSIDTNHFWDTEVKNMAFETNAIDIRFENSGNNVLGKIRFYGFWTYNVLLAINRNLPDKLMSGHVFINFSEPKKATFLKRGSGLYLPSIEKNDVGQIVRRYRKY